jgi:MFS family permease
MGFINFSFTIIGALLVDRLGRKILLLVSIIGMTLCTLALGVFFFLVERDQSVAESLSWLPLTSLSIFLISFAIGYGPVVWLMISEVYSKELSGGWCYDLSKNRLTFAFF